MKRKQFRKFVGAIVMSLGILVFVSLMIKYYHYPTEQTIVWYRWVLSGCNIVFGAYMLTDD